MRVGDCFRCGAAIEWWPTENDKQMPLDPLPTADGNVVIRSGRAHVLKKVEQESLFDDGAARYTPHFATCPDWK